LSKRASEKQGENVPHADPLTAFIEIHRRERPTIRGSKRFNAGEHAWLGGHGAARACAELFRTRGIRVDDELFTSIRRAHGRDELHYGELVALSGDLYESPETLFEERPSPLPWLWEGNDLSDIREIVAKETRWIEEAARAHGPSPYPDENLRFAWNAKSFVELALKNTDHFGWHNVTAYRRHHAKALQLAVEARGRPSESFRRALYTNAFADHFLTDCFAAGHVRIPRAEIRRWAQQRGLGEKIAGALSKVLHDQDGHVDLGSLHGVVDENARPADDGLLVQDSTGTTWRTRCDGQLFAGQGSRLSPKVERAVEAVATSVLELLLAWQRGEMPRGLYAATELVPFPHADGPSLIKKFPADMDEAQLEQLWDSIGWYAKVPWLAGLERQHLRALFQALPDIMAQFRANVAAAADADADLRARVAPNYLAAYRRVA
jgi:hypothetical protein